MTMIVIRTGAGEENVGEVWCHVQGPYVPESAPYTDDC